MDQDALKQQGKFSSLFNPKENPVGFVAFLFIAFILFGALTVYINSSRNQQNSNPDELKQANKKFEQLSNSAVVYGYWTDQGSHVDSVNLKTGEISEVAVLPSSIKRIFVSGSEKIMFINGTDSKDHGKEIAAYDVASKLTTPIVSSSQGYGIDEFVISPNGRYLATWEVIFTDGKTLKGGKSRVYGVDLQNPQVKNLIYEDDLSQTTYAHYPLGVTDTGLIAVDTFEPGTSAGWANGMSTSDITGTQKETIGVMGRGTYATQPQLSPDGRLLAFAGYNGSLGSGSINVRGNDGFRQAILSPNTVETFDLTTKIRTTLPNISAANRYPDVTWDRATGKIIYSMISKDASTNGTYLYDIAASQSKKIDTLGDAGQKGTYAVVSGLEQNKYLSGQYDLSPSAQGNLGPSYAQPLTEISVYDATQNKRVPINVGQSLMQFIAVTPVGYFRGANIVGQADNSGSGRINSDQLQLHTFVIKPTLEPVRIEQQSTGRCRDVAAERCNSLLGKSFTGDQARADGGTGDKAYDACFTTEFTNARKASCSDSPLYLYGEKGTNVKVTVGTPIYNSNIKYDGMYSGVLTGDGGISVGGKEYDNIDFDYTVSLRKFPTLNYGKTVRSSEVGEVVSEYGKKLGLNYQEISDTVKKIGQINSEYVFVSFFDDETSKIILPLDIVPTPDVYRNVVFFLKPVSEPIVASAPEFGKYPERQGFTAVEVSFIIDR